MEYYSLKIQNGDGAESQFSIHFGYLAKSHIHAKVSEIEVGLTWINDSVIELSVVPSVGEVIEIYRNTPKERMVDFGDGSFLTEANLDLDSLQHIYISQEAIDLANRSMLDSLETVTIANEAKIQSDQAIAESAEALSITSGMQSSVDAASQAAQDAALAAEEAITMAEESNHGHINKDSLDLLNVDTTGSFELSVNGSRVAMASELLDASGFVGTDGANVDVVNFKSLLGIDAVASGVSSMSDDLNDLEVETSSQGSSIISLESRLEAVEGDSGGSGLVIAPQTIVNGDVSYPVSGCDYLANHLTYSGSEITVHAGLQVGAGVDGVTVLSNELETDAVLNMSSASDGTHYIHATLSNGDLTAGHTDKEPELGLSRLGSLVKITPDMTSDSAPAGYLITASAEYSGRYAWYAFNGVINSTFATGWDAGSQSAGWIQIQLPTAQALDVVTITAPNDGADRAPNDLTILGSSDGQAWETAIDVTGLEWGAGESKSFELPSTMNYSFYRVTGVCDASYLNIAEIQLFSKVMENDFYDTSSHIHYDSNGDSISRVYIGECTVASGAITDVVNYQHGTTITMPVNEGSNVVLSSKYYLDRPYLGECSTQVRVYVDSKWGIPRWLNAGSGYGVQANMTDGVLSVQTAGTKLTYNTSYINGGEDFSTEATTAPAKVTVERSW